MEPGRIAELNFMVRTQTPVPVVESRNDPVFSDSLLDDHYTFGELISEGLMRYVGRVNQEVYVRPLTSFAVYTGSETRHLVQGEIVMLEISNWDHEELARRDQDCDQ